MNLFNMLMPSILAFQSPSQNPAPAQVRASFDVASIKPHPEPINVSLDPSISGTRVTATASTLEDLITSAYGVQYNQISGAPAWAKSEHYDLAARAGGESAITKQQMHAMLQTLLAERFRLVTHWEKREVPAYALLVGRKGPKLRESTPGAPRTGFVKGGAAGIHMETSDGTMEQLAQQLSSSAGLPVVDQTGLTGHYEFKLDWAPADRPPLPDSEVRDIFTAVQEQLGLKLERTKTLMETLVIDRAEKPSGN